MEKILVVDDELEVCNALREFLSLKGYEVHTAQDGVTAISQVKEVKPHIVLLDMIMPGMGGIDVLKEIKRIDSFSEWRTRYATRRVYIHLNPAGGIPVDSLIPVRGSSSFAA